MGDIENAIYKIRKDGKESIDIRNLTAKGQRGIPDDDLNFKLKDYNYQDNDLNTYIKANNSKTLKYYGLPLSTYINIPYKYRLLNEETKEFQKFPLLFTVRGSAPLCNDMINDGEVITESFKITFSFDEEKVMPIMTIISLNDNREIKRYNASACFILIQAGGGNGCNGGDDKGYESGAGGGSGAAALLYIANLKDTRIETHFTFEPITNGEGQSITSSIIHNEYIFSSITAWGGKPGTNPSSNSVRKGGAGGTINSDSWGYENNNFYAKLCQKWNGCAGGDGGKTWGMNWEGNNHVASNSGIDFETEFLVPYSSYEKYKINQKGGQKGNDYWHARLGNPWGGGGGGASLLSNGAVGGNQTSNVRLQIRGTTPTQPGYGAGGGGGYARYGSGGNGGQAVCKIFVSTD